MPFRPALPRARGVLPEFFRGNGERRDERAVGCIVRFRFPSGEADDRELVHCIHMILTVGPLFWGTWTASVPRSQSKPECIVGGTGGQVSERLRSLPGVPTKQNEGEAGRLGLSEAVPRTEE